MITQTRRLIDIAVNEFNYILDINLHFNRIEQIVSNIPQVTNGLTLEKFLETFGSNVPLVDKPKCKNFVNRIKYANKTKNYSTFYNEIRFSNIQSPHLFDWSSIKCVFDTSGDEVHIFIISRDITVEKETELEVIRSSQKDSLTNLLNRYAYNVIAKQVIVSATHNETKLAFFFIDIDNFKNVNDIYGHQEGDRILKEVATLLKDIFKSPSIVCRYGGDEFIAIVPDFIETSEMANLGNKLCKEFTKIETKDLKINISCSVGVSIFPLHSSNLEELVHFSDLALYYAKHLGKNQYSIYDKNNNKMDIAYSYIKPENQRISHQELLEAILDNDKTAILVTDPKNHRLVYANKAYCNLYNIPEQDIYNEDKYCYSIINGYLEPCKDCLLDSNVSDLVITHNFDKSYVKKTKKIRWKNQDLYISYYTEIIDEEEINKINKIKFDNHC